MKKLISILLLVACLCAVLTVSATAAGDPLAATFQDRLQLLDQFYDYNAEYWVRIASDYFVSWDNQDPVTISAAEFEGKLHAHFVLSDAQLNSVRQYEGWDGVIYDEATQTYTIGWYGGFGGIMPAREYWGYVKNGEKYDVYYRGIAYGYLEDALPEGTNIDDVLGPLDYPAEYEYEGVIYESTMDGYIAILGYKDTGRKYTVEMNGNIVRIISVVDYAAGEAPDKFDDKVPTVEYDVPADNSVAIPENDCFEGDTVVKVERITAGTAMNTAKEAMKTVAEKFVAFEFTAKKDGATVQPNGKLAVTFAIPDGYSTNVKVYYMAKNGNLEQLTATVNAAKRTVTAELNHFSTYILADADSKPVVTPTTQSTTAPTTAPIDGTTTIPTTAPVDPTDPSINPTTEPTTVPSVAPTTVPTTVAPTTVPSTQPGQDGGDGGDSSIGLIIAIAAAVAVAAGVIAFVVIRKKK